MILDSLKNAPLYYGVATRLEEAFRHLAKLDLMTLETGTYELDGRTIFLNIVERELKRPEEVQLEVHNDYLDVQIVLAGKESFGWSERSAMQQPTAPFDQERDIQFFADEPQTYYTLLPGQFTILMPEDAHAPLVGEGPIRKAIVKVKL